MSQTKIPQRKLDIVENIVNELETYSTVGIVEMEGIGARTVQKLRDDLRDKAKIVLAKNTLMRKALEQSSLKGAEKLSELVKGSVAFLFTDHSPYSIANYLEKNRVKAPAKAGGLAPTQVIVQKMNTGFPPGTIISELNSVGLDTRIEGGTVALSKDTVVLEPGDRISVTLASILTRLDIEPFLVGLSLSSVLDKGDIILHKDLLIDFDAIRDELIFAYRMATNLSIESGFLTTETAPQVIGSAYNKALALATVLGYVSEDSAVKVFAAANNKVLALARAIREVNESALSEELLNQLK